MSTIKSYLQTHHTLGTLPPGWAHTVDVIRDAVQTLQVRLTRVEIKDGVLYLEDDGTSPHSEIFKRFAKSILQETARTCMVCGKFGIRRKEHDGKPPLCITHYATFINEV
jgi:hypothetical protein